MNNQKPSERIGQCIITGTEHNPKLALADDVRREIDSLHDRIEALELNAKVQANPEHFSSAPKQEPNCSKCGKAIYGDMTVSAKGDKFHVECPKQEPKCKHDKGGFWEALMNNTRGYETASKLNHPTCPYCPKQENKKLVQPLKFMEILEIFNSFKETNLELIKAIYEAQFKERL